MKWQENSQGEYRRDSDKRKMTWKVLERLSGLSLLVLISVSGQDPKSRVFQPASVSAVAGESVILHCFFSNPPEIEPFWNLKVQWRTDHFYGAYIYKPYEDFVRRDYRRRISMPGEPWSRKTASITISALRESDSNRYFCQIEVTKNDGRVENWQNNLGTELTVSVSAQEPRYTVFQPELVSAVVGGSVILPCSFSYPREIEAIWNLKVSWRINNPNGYYIYRHSEGFTHRDYTGRIYLHSEPWGEKTASIRISNVQERDSKRYFCRVQVTKNDGKTEEWQSLQGTNLAVSDPKRNGYVTFLPWTTMVAPSSRATSGLRVEGRTSTASARVDVEGNTRTTPRMDLGGRAGGPWQLHRMDLILLATVTSIFKLGICLAVALCFHWRRSDRPRAPPNSQRGLHSSPLCAFRLAVPYTWNSLPELQRNTPGMISKRTAKENTDRTEKRMTQVVLERLCVLPLLVLISGLAVSAQMPSYVVNQPESVSAVLGGSVTLPCSFSYPRAIEPLQDLRVYWRSDSFHGPVIYNPSEGFTRQDYAGRISLVGDPRGQKTASIRIRDLRERDSNWYFCRVGVRTNDGKTETWQSFPGTELTVTAVEISTLGVDEEGRTRATTPGATSPGADVGDRGEAAWLLHRTDLILLTTLSLAYKLGICLAVALCFHWCRCAKPTAAPADPRCDEYEVPDHGPAPSSAMHTYYNLNG
ncbi:uncharacterized protein LOC115077396 [Rhinatrema bivittatum]|uniref:uncharacterized protein LOC115077396 n=1 Tax=Rhinatrema bivittatum TaxID=194408 RepID=UPI0011294AA5|nr:uncharacterized protein LOC115077396 [Rhinatrema bivittatum]